MSHPLTALRPPLESPTTAIVSFFTLWKLILLLVAFLSPGKGYDTSGSFLWNGVGFTEGIDSLSSNADGWSAFFATKFARWDAIYFMTAVIRGFWFEQEWAFNSTYVSLVRLFSRRTSNQRAFTLQVITNGVVISNVAHLCSALILFHLVSTLYPDGVGARLATVTSLLYIVSPAGIFLSAPYSESLFALLNFSGIFFYVLSRINRFRNGRQNFQQHFLTLSSGICFGLATSIRSNGILSGTIFAYDAAIWLTSNAAFFWRIVWIELGAVLGFSIWAASRSDVILTFLTPDSLLNGRAFYDVRGIPAETFAVAFAAVLIGIAFVPDVLRMAPFLTRDIKAGERSSITSTILAGMTVGAGLIVPQIKAYSEFCIARNGATDVPPWCNSFFPSIYSSVQARYWNVGLFKYWTISNLPLFIIATPVLSVIITSSLQFLHGTSSKQHLDKPASSFFSIRKESSKDELHCNDISQAFRASIFRRLALPEVIVACLALSSFHVQIINRISSGYPLWYLAIATGLSDYSTTPRIGRKMSRWMVYFMVIYALFQAALFASFLPPA